MKSIKWPAQFLLTLFASTLIPNNVVKTFFLLAFWLVTFKPLQKKEILFFTICSLVFTFSNYGALANKVFVFTSPDIILMPFNEIFMWGFYCLNANRFIEALSLLPSPIQPRRGKVLIYAVSFSLVFSVIHSEMLLVLILFLLMGCALIFFHSKRDLCYLMYFLFMGVIVEMLGLIFGLWHYPHAEYLKFPLWAPLMWTNIGLIMSQVSALFFPRIAKP
ncbi:MAG: hypothetical protein IPK04_16305 [Bdellovibrionales bacterium]|nr:hypothetical protein [Bdellovibrionales bacterium]